MDLDFKFELFFILKYINICSYELMMEFKWLIIIMVINILNFVNNGILYNDGFVFDFFVVLLIVWIYKVCVLLEFLLK